MKTRTAALSAIAALAPLAQAQPIEYQVTFDSTWSAQTHPTAFPNDPHYSPLLAFNHVEEVSVWGPGQIASPGIEQMAETGGTTILRGEIDAMIGVGLAGQRFSVGGFDSPGSRSLTVNVTDEFPLLTLTTMIAPSPDWFIGVHDLDLREGDSWVQTYTTEVLPYDAGTDAGVSYTSGNSDVTPHAPITRIDALFPFTGFGSLGTITIERITDLSCNEADLALPEGVLDFTDVIAFLGAFGAQESDADLSEPFGTFDFSDVIAFLGAFGAGCP